MAHINTKGQLSNLARIIIEQDSLHKPQITLHDKKMRNGALTVTYLNGKNKSPTLAKRLKSNQEGDDNDDVIIIEDEYPKKIEQNNDGEINEVEKKKEKNKDNQNITDIQENNKKQILFQENEQINENGLLKSRKRVEQYDNDHLYRKKNKTEKNEDTQKKSSVQENNYNQILIQREVHINNDYRLLQPSSTTKCEEFQRLESCEFNQVDNRKCLTIEEPNDPLSTKIVESKDKHFYKCLICQTSFSKITDFENHSKISYTCYVCYVTFCTLTDLECHKKLHNAMKSLKCYFCKLKFSKESSLDKHIKDSHIETEVPNSNKTTHIQTHNRSIKCDVCKSSFEQKSLLQSHKCLKPFQVYECNVYEKELNEKFDLEHLLSLHEDVKSKVEMPPDCLVTSLHQESLFKSNKNGCEDEKPCICEICFQCFSEQSSLLRHEKTHVDIKHECCLCEQFFYKKSDLICHMEYHSSDAESCLTCNQVFNDKSQFKSHNCIQHNKTYQCNICGKEFNEESDLKLHASLHKDVKSKVEMPPNCQVSSLHQESDKNVSDDEKPFVCETCYQCFSEQSSLLQHEKTHIDIKYKCYHCEKEFYKKSDLICHLEYHSYKAESCLTCNKVFNDKSQFESHKCIQHNKTYQCKICGKEFNEESDLKLHASLHKDVNSKVEMPPDWHVSSLHQESLLKSNKNVYDDEKPFKCETCCQCFTKKSSLHRHEKTHIDIKYECYHCEKIFYKKSHLICHMEYHSSKSENCLASNQMLNDKTQFKFHKYLAFDETYQCIVCGEEFKHESNAELLMSLFKNINSKIESIPNFQAISLHQEPLFRSDKRVLSDEKLFKYGLCNQSSCKQLLIGQEKLHLDINYKRDFLEKLFYQKLNSIFHMIYHPIKTSENDLSWNQVCNEKLFFQFHKYLKLEKIYQCSYCEEEFKHESDAKVHLSLHKNINSKIEMPPNCQVTPLDQKFQLNLKNSILSTVEKTFKCEFCNKLFPRESLLIWHKTLHVDVKKYYCYFCGKVFYKKSDLISHMKFHSLNTTESCPICNRRFKNKSFLDLHIKTLHSEVNLFTCHLCNDIVYSESKLIDHLMAHEYKNKHACSSSFVSHLEINIFEESFLCEICNMHFELKTPFDSHMKNHCKDNLYPCDNTKARQDENQFYKSKNNEENPIECHICKMLFIHEDNLLKYSEKHRNGNNYICLKPYISQLYSIKYESEVNHLNQYQCDICKTFISKKKELVHHIKKHLKKKNNLVI